MGKQCRMGACRLPHQARIAYNCNKFNNIIENQIVNPSILRMSHLLHFGAKPHFHSLLILIPLLLFCSCGGRQYKTPDIKQDAKEGIAISSKCTQSCVKCPEDATYLCKDGVYSCSQTPQGSCSWHGGVAKRLTRMARI